MFRIWIGNLGKYNEGYLVGEWVDLPCDDFDEVFERIGINERYEETFIADFENDYGYEVGEYDSLTMLNEVAETLEGLNEYEKEVWTALHDGGYNNDEIIEILENDNYMIWDCDDMGDVARRIYEVEIYQIEKICPYLVDFIDWDRLGDAIEADSCGGFYPCDFGYVEVFR